VNIQTAEIRDPAPGSYVATDFAFPAVEGLSRHALDLHLQLYRGYVKQVNGLQRQVTELAALEHLSERDRLRKDGLIRRLAFEYNGMILHELFFEQLDGRPEGDGPEDGSVLQQAMQASFGGIDDWRNDIAQLADTRGVGWVVAARQAGSRRLINTWISEHQLGLPVNVQIIAVFDLWEHAYLLDFSPTARGDYLSVLFWNLDWRVIESRCH
jgi:superoxide dismutase, Fe-Mn family